MTRWVGKGLSTLSKFYQLLCDVFMHFRNYIEKESLKKRGTECNWDGWSFYYKRDIPQQENGHDCGVFYFRYIIIHVYYNIIIHFGVLCA